MSTTEKFHPADQLLADFAGGKLSAGMSVVIAAHVEQCQTCSQMIARLEEDASSKWLAEEPADSVAAAPATDFSDIAANIIQMPQVKDVASVEPSHTEMHMLDHSVRLPKVLAKIASEGLVWKKLAGGINQASVALDDETQCEFLYMKPGSQVPVHKHQGKEVTLVLDGSFSDELGKYGPADFVVRDTSHTHQPASEEGCLCFAVLDSPLTFTSGLARLLNPFLKYRFKRATSAGTL